MRVRVFKPKGQLSKRNWLYRELGGRWERGREMGSHGFSRYSHGCYSCGFVSESINSDSYLSDVLKSPLFKSTSSLQHLQRSYCRLWVEPSQSCFRASWRTGLTPSPAIWFVLHSARSQTAAQYGQIQVYTLKDDGKPVCDSSHTLYWIIDASTSSTEQNQRLPQDVQVIRSQAQWAGKTILHRSRIFPLKAGRTSCPSPPLLWTM